MGIVKIVVTIIVLVQSKPEILLKSVAVGIVTVIVSNVAVVMVIIIVMCIVNHFL